MNRESSVRLSPKLYISLILIGLAMIGMFYKKDLQGQIMNVGISVLTGAIFDVLVGIFQKRKQLFPDGAIVSGFIIALVLSASTPWYVCIMITLLALGSKHLLKSKRKPLFNPAAFGLLLAIILFSSMQSWWGGLSMLPAWCLIFVLIGGFLVVDRVNKFPLVFTFLGTYFLLLLIMGILNIGDAADALRTPFLNSTLFFAFFMLTDPPTSPGKYKDQIFFGVITAVVGAMVYAISGWLGYLLVGLLTANLWHFVTSKKAAPIKMGGAFKV